MPAKRLSDNVHKLKGTFRKDRHGDPNLKIEFDEPDGYPAPDYLPDSAKQEWFRITNLYKGTGVIAEPDFAVLAGYCQLIGSMQDHPDKVKMATHAQLTRYANILGFGALNRQSVQSPAGLSTSHQDAGNRFAKFTKKAVNTL